MLHMLSCPDGEDRGTAFGTEKNISEMNLQHAVQTIVFKLKKKKKIL